MLVIRLQRTGKRNSPSYRLVVAEKSNPVKGKFIELLGHYLPTRDPSVFEYKEDRVANWISNGATPSNTAARLLNNAGMKGLEKYIDTYTKKKPKKEPEEKPEEAPAPAPIAEEPKEEVKEEPQSSGEGM